MRNRFEGDSGRATLKLLWFGSGDEIVSEFLKVYPSKKSDDAVFFAQTEDEVASLLSRVPEINCAFISGSITTYREFFESRLHELLGSRVIMVPIMGFFAVPESIRMTGRVKCHWDPEFGSRLERVFEALAAEISDMTKKPRTR